MLRPIPDTAWAAAAARVSWAAPRAVEETLRAGTVNGDRGTVTGAGAATRLSGPLDDAPRAPADRDPDLPDPADPACTLAAGPD